MRKVPRVSEDLPHVLFLFCISSEQFRLCNTDFRVIATFYGKMLPSVFITGRITLTMNLTF